MPFTQCAVYNFDIFSSLVRLNLIESFSRFTFSVLTNGVLTNGVLTNGVLGPVQTSNFTCAEPNIYLGRSK